MSVAPATLATASCNQTIVQLHKILDDKAILRIDDDRAWRHPDDQILAVASVPVRALSVCTAFGSPELAVGQSREVVDIAFGYHDDAAADAAVPTVGTASRDVPLTPEADTARAAIARMDFDFDTIHKHLGPNPQLRKKDAPLGAERPCPVSVRVRSQPRLPIRR